MARLRGAAGGAQQAGERRGEDTELVRTSIQSTSVAGGLASAAATPPRDEGGSSVADGTGRDGRGGAGRRGYADRAEPPQQPAERRVHPERRSNQSVAGWRTLLLHNNIADRNDSEPERPSQPQDAVALGQGHEPDGRRSFVAEQYEQPRVGEPVGQQPGRADTAS